MSTPPDPPPIPTTVQPLHLDAQTVVLTAQVAYDLGLMTQQGPTPTVLYRDASRRPDAIGASLPDDMAYAYASVPVSLLPITTDNLPALQQLQQASDAWARNPSNPLMERQFVLTLNRLREELA